MVQDELVGRDGEAFVLLEIDGAEHRLPLERPLTIGRDRSNDLILDGHGVSRHHAMIRAQPGGLVLVDLGSSNGTFVNSRLAGGPMTLAAGDEIGIGDRSVRDLDGRAPDENELDSDLSPGGYKTVRSFVPREVCLLVSDIRSFTHLSESLPDERLPRIVADWFRIVDDLVRQRGGTIEKFRGDSVMACWIAPRNDEVAATVTRALDAAGDIVRRAADYDREVGNELAGDDFRVGCGVHRGLAFQGNIGSDSRRDITMLGDCVNVTYRIESLCAPLDRPILVSAEVRQAAGAAYRFETLGSHALKGKTEPLELFAPLT